MPNWTTRTSPTPSWNSRTPVSSSWSQRSSVTSNQKFYLNALFGGVAFRLKTVDGSNLLIGSSGAGSTWNPRVIPS